MYTVYKTTNSINQRFYIGVHKTLDPDDSYLGSGLVLKQAVAKYGMDSFVKEVLALFPEAAGAFSLEQELVAAVLGDPLCMNLKQGGAGGFDLINEKGLNDRTGSTFSAEQRAHIGRRVRESMTQERREAQAERLRGKKIGLGNKASTGRKSSDETKEKIRQAILQNTSIIEEVTCPHCGKVGAKNAMKRWHFDKCSTRRN